MIVLRIENNTPYVQLTLGQQNLNAGIRAILRQSSLPTTTIVTKERVKQLFYHFSFLSESDVKEFE